MKELKLNSISSKVFFADDASENKIAVNNKTLSRKAIVSTGRLVACEYIGNLINNQRKANKDFGVEEYVSRLNGTDYDYPTLQRKHVEKKLLFCAAQACKMTGQDAPENFEEFRKQSMRFAQDPVFLRTMAAIDRDVIQPLYMAVIDSVGMSLMQWEAIPFGGTKEVNIGSNDSFIFEDTSWGASHSATANYLYAKTLTLNPAPMVCKAKIKWYQDIVQGDAGRYYAAIINGMYSKIYAKMIRAFKAAVAGSYVPEGLKATTYSTQNWLAISDKVAAVNGVLVDNLMAIGARSSLSQLLPVDGTGGAITGLQYGLGQEWFRNGFLPKAGAVDLFAVSPVIVPGTQNTTIDTIDTGNDIYILAKRGYAPIIGGYYEGTPIDLVATPAPDAGVMGTADFTIEINVTATMDAKPVFASKIGVIKSVYAS